MLRSIFTSSPEHCGSYHLWENRFHRPQKRCCRQTLCWHSIGSFSHCDDQAVDQAFFFSTEYSVLVPSALVLLEAFLRLYARDVDTRIGSFAMTMIGYMEEYVDDDGLLDGDLFAEPLKTFYRELRRGEKPARQWTDELKNALGRGFESCGSIP